MVVFALFCVYAGHLQVLHELKKTTIKNNKKRVVEVLIGIRIKLLFLTLFK